MLREELGSFDIAAVTFELNHAVKGFRINNIYQINPKSLLLKLRGLGESSRQLLVEAGKRINITSYIVDKPLKPPGFCMALRKHLSNGILEDFRQHQFERIVEFVIRNHGQTYRLIIELFGEGNIVLLGDKDEILLASVYRRMRDRDILHGKTFVYPPQRGIDPTSLSLERLKEVRIFGQISAVRGFTRFLSIGGHYVEETLLRAGVDKDTYCSKLTDEDFNAIFSSLQEILTIVTSGNIQACIFVNNEGDWLDIAPFPMKKFVDLETLRFNTFNEALDEYFSRVSVAKKTLDIESFAGRDISKLERILRDQEETLRDLTNKAEVYRKIGDSIYTHPEDLDLLLQRIMQEKRNERSWKEIVDSLRKEKGESRVPAIFFEDLIPENLSLQVSIEGTTFDLNLKESARKNAGEYYSKVKKARSKIEGVKEAIRETQERIDKARLQLVEKVERASQPQSRKERQEWYEKFHWFCSSDGFLVIGGKDASTNETIVKRHVEPQDIVFHGDVSGSPFVVVKYHGSHPPEQTIAEAAKFTASHSRVWKEALRSVDVYWVFPDQVSKTPPSGQYLSRGSFMIYGTKNYVKNVTLEAAVGVRKENEHFRVIGGPPEAISKQTDLYAILVPGKEPSGKLTRKIRDRLANAASREEREDILKLPLEEIQKFIPSGLGTLS